MPNASEEPLRGVRAEHANEEKSNNDSGEPQFHQAPRKRPLKARPPPRGVHFQDVGVSGF
jgi:hypothetical protein